MSNVRVYDPPMCCSTGVCGPDEDDELAQFAAALEGVKKTGVNVDRFNLGHQPGEFVSNATIKDLLTSEGVEVLPIVMVGDDIVSKGDYPSPAALTSKLGLEGKIEISNADTQQGGEASKSSNCCA